MKRSEIMAAVEDGKTVCYTVGDGLGQDYLTVESILICRSTELSQHPERFSIKEQKKRLKVCAFNCDGGDIRFAIRNSKLFNRLLGNAICNRIPELDIEVEVDE